MARFRTAVAGWWSRSVVWRWRALPQNARLASVGGVFLAVILVATGFAVVSQPARPGPTQSGSASPMASPSEVVVASATATSTPPTSISEQPSVASLLPTPTGPATPSPTRWPKVPTATFAPMSFAAPIAVPTLATFPCKPYVDDLVVSGGLLYVYCNASGVSDKEAVVAIDLSTNRIVRTYDFRLPNDLGPCPEGAMCYPSAFHTLAVDHGLWVGGGDSGIERLDLTTGQASLRQGGWQFLGYTPGRIWVVIPHDNGTSEEAIVALDPGTGNAEPGVGLQYGSAIPSLESCSAMVFVYLFRWNDGSDELRLVRPARSSEWRVQLTRYDYDVFEHAGQADGGCWALMSSDILGVHLARLGLDGIELETNLIKDPSAYWVRVAFYDGQAWLVRRADWGTSIQRLDLSSFKLQGKPMRVPYNWLGIAAGSIWARNTQGYLVRLGINGATPAPATPSPTPTIGPTPTAGSSS